MVKVRENSSIALSELYNRYSPRLLSFLYRLTYGNEESAQDLLQDTFIKVIDNAYRFDKDKKFSTWIYTIAANLCKNELRRISIRKNKHQEMAFYPEENDRTYESVEEILDQKYLSAVIKTEIDALKIESRKLLILRFHEELPVREIAKIMNLPEGTVKSRLHHLIKKLSLKLNKKHRHIIIPGES